MCKSCNKIAGHNSRTCKQRLEKIKAKDATTDDQADRQGDLKKRRLCSICNKRERHNARTCQERDAAKKEEDEEEEDDEEEDDDEEDADDEDNKECSEEEKKDDEPEEANDEADKEETEDSEDPSSTSNGKGIEKTKHLQESKPHGRVTRNNTFNTKKTNGATNIEPNAVHTLRRSSRNRT